MKWQEDSKYQFRSRFEPLIAEFSEGKIVNEHSLIYHNSELFIRRITYDRGFNEIIHEVRTTQDLSIMGPILDSDEHRWETDVFSAITACGYRDYQLFIIDSRLLNPIVEEIKVYIYDTTCDLQFFKEKMSQLEVSIIPVITDQNLDHYIPDLIDNRLLIRPTSPLQFRGAINICSLKWISDKWQIDVIMENVDDLNSDLR